MKKTLIVAQLLLTTFTFAQRVAEEQVSFHRRISEPIKMEVSKSENSVDFVAVNQSAFPYELEVEFQTLINLRSFGNVYKAFVSPGRNRIFSLAILDTKQAHNYSYRIKYSISIANKNIDPNFPYLIPLAKGKKATLFMSGHQVSPGDTIFAMRKGIVTGVPNNGLERDQIMENALEIFHADGSICVYPNLDPKSIFVSFGRKVYAGQPIGIVQTSFIRPAVLKCIDAGRFQSMPVIYALTSDQTISSKAQTEVVVDHPENIVTRELSKSELKKFKKGSLYENDGLK